MEKYTSFLHPVFTQQLHPEQLPLPCPGAVTAEQVQHHPRTRCTSAAGERLLLSLPDPKAHRTYCVNIRHYYLPSPHGITLWNLLLLFGAQIETLWPCMNAKPA